MSLISIYDREKKVFSDGSYIEPADRISIFYKYCNYYISIEVIEKGKYWFFNVNPKIYIHKKSLKEWTGFPEDKSKNITKEQFLDISKKIKEYFGNDFGDFID